MAMRSNMQVKLNGDDITGGGSDHKGSQKKQKIYVRRDMQMEENIIKRTTKDILVAIRVYKGHPYTQYGYAT